MFITPNHKLALTLKIFAIPKLNNPPNTTRPKKETYFC